MRIVPSLALFVTLTVPLTGCVMDLNKIASDLRKPTVVFATPASWRCMQEKATLPTGNGTLEPCTVCVNITATPQAVTINKTEHRAEPNGTVALCETNAFVSAPIAATQTSLLPSREKPAQKSR